jgi:transposase
MARFDLSDAEWDIIAPLLPGADGKRNGRPRLDDRKVLNGIFFVLRTGTPWRDLPERYGPYTTVYNRFNRWAKRGVWIAVFEALSARSPPIDAPDRFLHRARPPARRRRKKGGADHAIGRSRGGLTTKINVLVDGNGLPIRILLSPGQASDKAAVPGLIAGIAPGRDLLADRGYDAQAILDQVAAAGGRAHIPTCRDRKVQRSVDRDLYRQRNLVERFFNKLKHFRRIATRYDKHAQNFLSAVLIAASLLWMRFESTT